jgi:geranylgeranyl diphosphate synthase type I
MSLTKLTRQYQPAVEASLQQAVARVNGPDFSELHRMMAYHMGWQGQDAGPEAQGKRIRPLLVLLTTAACQADWQAALPAATAIELVHNFSLIHDDIEDNSPLRRGRSTVWTR